MLAGAEEHARRAVELRHHHTLGTVYHECALGGHVWNLAQIHVLYLHHRIRVIGIGLAGEAQFGLQRHTVGGSALYALVNGVARVIYIVIEKLERIVVSGVRNREILLEHLVHALLLTLLGRSVELEEIAERFQLDLEQIGIRQLVPYLGKADSRFVFCLWRHYLCEID